MNIRSHGVRPALAFLLLALVAACAPPEVARPTAVAVAGSFAPPSPPAADLDAGSRRMLVAAERYEAIAAAGGWPVVPAGPALRLGASGPRVALLRARLDAEGDPREHVGAGDRFDESVAEAVRRFQKRHGLDEDGIVGPSVLAALDVPAAERGRQLRLNVERRRLAGAPPLGRHVVVNVPAFSLEVRDGESVALEMRVIAGTRWACTPSLSSEITHAIVNPYWNLPHRLARKEILPLLRKDRGYLAREHIRVFRRTAPRLELDPSTIDWTRVSASEFPYHLRQDPGPWNALGRLKFVFANTSRVYLHDTPKPELFARTTRAFSHGCVRLEKPVELAEALLAPDPGWDRTRLLGAIESGVNQAVRIRRPIPIRLTYQTAWVDPDGTTQFRADYCGRDVPSEKARRS